MVFGRAFSLITTSPNTIRNILVPKRLSMKNLLQRRNRLALFSSGVESNYNEQTKVGTTGNHDKEGFVEETFVSPWHPDLVSANNKTRFRQHVNPLARRFQMSTDLPEGWPASEFSDLKRPLHVDIGCGKGGYLLDLATKDKKEELNETKNYLGLEIRPTVAAYARERVEKHELTGLVSFLGCNANVDLERILSLYRDSGGGVLEIVSIQFPDPHFKKNHGKRRVVTPELVDTLARFLPRSSRVFLQSDIKEVFDGMRMTFRDSCSFQDEVPEVEAYLEENPTGVPTEREVSVLDKNLPVYRTLFRRV
eukprot:CAMPEP_0118696584 /NCGR_PEP_ID=MMETSP0800-20121206/13936_1 /TAXON_ID=210618 ORGANISM="Striatella unipunctata, Strain CCMP2910" /NCGR_SAMPLE_ID=MMETSP0800 /ASSEMBLY_ACC=CAM_ASM_000638 /LENGTH=307 /DNA_ID=CAMNT_0006595729 /DNA_START=29 /DNA_END=952 /DNA_ORIENTATION=+